MDKEKAHVGTVMEDRAGGLHLVELHDGRQVLCYLAGKMRHNKVRVFIGDRVEILLDPYGGKATNRIMRRY